MSVSASDPPSMHLVGAQPTSRHSTPPSHTATPETPPHNFTPPSITAIRQTTPPNDLPPSPPVTPQVIKTTGFPPTNTPTQLGILLANQKATVKREPPLTLGDSWKKMKEKQAWLMASYKQSYASMGIVINDATAKKYLKGCMKVATAMLIGPPTDPEYAEQHTYALGLVFSSKMRLGTPRLAYLMVVKLNRKNSENTSLSMPVQNPTRLSPFILPRVSLLSTNTTATTISGSNLPNKWHGFYSRCIKSSSRTLLSPILAFAGTRVVHLRRSDKL